MNFLNKFRGCFSFPAALIGFMLATNALYATDLAASEKLVERVFMVLRDDIGAVDNLEERQQRLSQLIMRYGDREIMARQSLGVAGRRASKAQIEAFTDAFTHYLVAKYGKSLYEIKIDKVTIAASRKIKSYAQVDVVVMGRSGARAEVTILAIERGGKTRFFNIIIGGVNLILNERQEINLLLDRRGGDIDKLIMDLPTLYQ